MNWLEQRSTKTLWACVTGVLLLAALGLLLASPGTFIIPWLACCNILLALCLGSTILMQVWQLSGGRWLPPMAPTLRLLAMATPFACVLFAAVLLQPGVVAYWLRPESPEVSEIVSKRGTYATTGGLILRSLLCALVFSGVGWQAAAAVRRTLAGGGRSRAGASIGLILLALACFFFAVDWQMSPWPHWYSTMYPFLVFIGAAVLALGVGVVSLSFRPECDADCRRYAANLLLAAVCLWLYLAFMQFLIIWMGNLPVEAEWYLSRAGGFWIGLTLVVLAVAWAGPFFLLLPLPNRVRRATIAGAGASAAAGQVLYLLWVLMPAHEGGAWAAFGLGLGFALLPVSAALAAIYFNRADGQ